MAKRESGNWRPQITVSAEAGKPVVARVFHCRAVDAERASNLAARAVETVGPVLRELLRGGGA